MNEEVAAPSNSPIHVEPGNSSPGHTSATLLHTNETGDTSLDSSSRIFDNLEEILLELNNFEKEISKTSSGSLVDLTIPSTLESYLKLVATAGSAQFSWSKIKPLFRVKLEQVIQEFNSSSPTAEIPIMPNVDPFNFDAVKGKVFEQLEAFVGIPFTVQRLAELITSPRRHYRRTDKFMRALEKNMLVVSTVEARAVAAAAAANDAASQGVTHNMMNGNEHGMVKGNGSEHLKGSGSEHNVLPMTSHNMRRAQSPTSSGFVKTSKLSESLEKAEPEAKLNGGDEAMDQEEEDSQVSDKHKTDKLSNDLISDNVSDPKLSDNPISDKTSTLSSENSATDKNPDSSEMEGTSSENEANASNTDSEKSKDEEMEDQPSTSEDAPSEGGVATENVEETTENDATSSSSATETPVTPKTDDATSSSDVKQEMVEESSSQNESSPEESKTSSGDTPVGTTTEGDCQTEATKPDEGEPVLDDGGPCDSADSNQTTSVTSAPSQLVTESSDTSSTPATEVGSSNEPQDPSACAATSSETKDAGETQVEPSADASSDQATSSKCESGPDDSMEVDAECTSSETQIHISST